MERVVPQLQARKSQSKGEGALTGDGFDAIAGLRKQWADAAADTPAVVEERKWQTERGWEGEDRTGGVSRVMVVASPISTLCISSMEAQNPRRNDMAARCPA